MANLYTYMVKTMKKSPSAAAHYKGILKKVDEVLKTIEDLQEDPLFIDKIHGEQELSLDQSLELFSGIRVHFAPDPKVIEVTPEQEAASFDAS